MIHGSIAARFKGLACLMLGLAWLTGCAGNKPFDSRRGSAMEEQRTQSSFDRDSRNNEDQTLGVKSGGAPMQRPLSENNGRDQLDSTNEHLAKSVVLRPELAAGIKELPGIQDAYVLLSEVNAYVAVVLDGHRLEEEAAPDVSQYRITPKGGIGLFGNDNGSPNRISWGDLGGLSASQADEIRKRVLAAGPAQIQEVFVSSNPNFAGRARFYAAEAKDRGTLADYLNEFNTLVQHVFPADVNTRK